MYAQRRASPLTQARTQPAVVPAPVKGINSSASLAAMQPDECIFTYNLLPTEIGMQTRPGYMVHAEGMAATADGVLTIIPFEGMANGTKVSKLFACCNRGIYDITDRSQTPPEVYTWPDRSQRAGYCSYAPYTNIASASYLIVADEVNGLVEYDATADTWAPKTLTGVDAATLNQVLWHQGRFYFTQRASTTAWYLPPELKDGTVTELPFGGQFRNGGDLVGMYSWSRSDGAGMDDYLVVVSRGGDVLVYQGSNPATVTSWGLVGSHSIGQVPSGNRIALEYGSDMFLLSKYGLVSLKDLQSLDIEAATSKSPSKRIERILRTHMTQYIKDDGWELALMPGNNSLAILSPWIPGRTTFPVQFILALSTGAWGITRGADMRTVCEYGSDIFWGDMTSGTVYDMIDGPDGVAFDGTGGYPVQFSTLTAYNGLGSPAHWKTVHMIRTRHLSDAVPAIESRAMYDYNLTIPGSAPPYREGGGAVWDVSLWDSGIWSSDPYSQRVINGSTGPGHMVAIATRGQTTQRMLLVQYDMMAEMSQGTL